MIAPRPRLSQLFARIWASETLMTWLSFLVRSLNFLLVLPILLRMLPDAEFAAFMSFQPTFIGLCAVLVGVEPNFVRMLATLIGGGDIPSRSALPDQMLVPNRADADEDKLRRLLKTIQTFYWGMFALVVLLMGSVGSIMVRERIMAMQAPGTGWVAWTVFLIGAGVFTFGGAHSCYLLGLGHVALARRWESLILLTSLLAAAVAVLLGGGIVGFLVAQQAIYAAGVLVRSRLTRPMVGKYLKGKRLFFWDREYGTHVFASSWKMGLGAFLHAGLFNLLAVRTMGHMGAQDAASFGLTWKCITTSTDFSRAPFYSKIPRMSRLLAEGRRADMLVVARRGMKLGFLSYLFGCLCVAVLGDFMLEFLGTDIRLLGPLPWAAFSAAFLLERYSAMHLQLYTISHHVVWHRVYLLGALLCVGAFSACMQGGLLVLGLAIGVGVSEVFCCSLWTPTLSRRYYEYRYWSFDGRVFLPCLGLFLVWILMLLI